MKREEVERVVWKVLTRYDERPCADDVDMIMACVDAYTREERQRRQAKRSVHYAPMPGLETACGLVNPAAKDVRITGHPAEADCVNCRATRRWRHDITLAAKAA